MINLTVNGKPRPIDDNMDLESYLDSFGLDLNTLPSATTATC